MSDLFVETIDGQRILDQIVGANTEKFASFRQRIRAQGRGRDFDHSSDLKVWIEGNPFLLQFFLILLDQRVGLKQFLQARNHRVHQFDISMGAGAQDGPKLVAKNLLLLQAEANSSPTQKRIHLIGHLQMRQKFVAAQVERSDDDRVGFEGRGHFFVGLILLFLSGQYFPVDEQILRAK